MHIQVTRNDPWFYWVRCDIYLFIRTHVQAYSSNEERTVILMSEVQNLFIRSHLQAHSSNKERPVILLNEVQNLF